MSKLH